MTTVVAVPIYKETLLRSELCCFLRLRQLDIENVILVAPFRLDIGNYQRQWPEIEVARFDNSYFSDIESYNRLMLSSGFYRRFRDRADYILICQLDAFLMSNLIDVFAALPFDYFGAPWRGGQLVSPYVRNPNMLKFVGKRVYVGNGGLSLRKISTTISLLERRRSSTKFWRFNEDGFFSYWGIRDDRYKSCPVEIASQFAIETDPEYWIGINDKLPMGFHGFEKCSPNFYKSVLEKEFRKLEGMAL